MTEKSRIKSFSIDSRPIGSGNPCFLIAEIAQGHDGSLGLAHSYVDAAAKAGADAIKFQTHIAAAESTKAEPFRVNFSYVDDSRYAYWRRMEFTADQWAELARHARERELIFLSSPFSAEAVDLLEALGMAAWKIASGEVFNLVLLDRLRLSDKPVLFSSGLSNVAELAAAVEPFQAAGHDVGVFQCTSEYPVALDRVGLNMLQEFRTRFQCPVGLSDHSGTPYPALAAIAQGADFIEVHLTFDRDMYGPDSPSSLTVAEFADLRAARDSFHIMLSNPVRKDDLNNQREHMRGLFTRSVALRRNMVKGAILSADDLTLKKPGTGIHADRLRDLVGRRLARDVSADDLLQESDLEPQERN